jgi:hypothetical protein
VGINYTVCWFRRNKFDSYFFPLFPSTFNEYLPLRKDYQYHRKQCKERSKRNRVYVTRTKHKILIICRYLQKHSVTSLSYNNCTICYIRYNRPLLTEKEQTLVSQVISCLEKFPHYSVLCNFAFTLTCSRQC